MDLQVVDPERNETLDKLDPSLSLEREDDNVSESGSDVSRDHWGSRCEFLLAIVGYTVGIGSIWRFPIKCANNGGGAFLIPFFFFTFFCGGPLYYIEVCIGQYSGMAAGAAFEFCPLFEGMCHFPKTMPSH